MSAQSAATNLGAAIGAARSTTILVEQPDGRLRHTPRPACVAIATTLALPFLVTAIARWLRRRDGVAAAATPG